MTVDQLIRSHGAIIAKSNGLAELKHNAQEAWDAGQMIRLALNPDQAIAFDDFLALRMAIDRIQHHRNLF
jgi:hypothetical protein